MNIEKILENKESIGVCMSNFDHTIEENINELNDENYGEYTAWDFFAYVVKAENKYKAFVLQYQVHVDTIEADTPEELMESVCVVYGEG